MTLAGIPALAEQNSAERNPHHVTRFFRSLGDALTAELGSSKDLVYARLETVATEILAKFNPSVHITPDAVIDYVLTAPTLCKQADLDGRFAEPPVSLYAGEHFDISALFWLDGTTSIHQHGFCGAFHVLSGSSIHSQYRFERQEVTAQSGNAVTEQTDHTPISPSAGEQPRAIEGTLHLLGCEVLHAGSTRTIPRGQGFIHALFHMVRPSVTIVIRTITDDPKQNVQYDYRWPGFGFDPFHRHAPTIRTQQFLKMLQKLDLTRYQERLLDVLKGSDLNLAYALLSEDIHRTADSTRARELADACLMLPVTTRDRLFQAAYNDLLSRSIIDLRRKLHDPDHRFLLALLLNVYDRGALLQRVASEFALDDPVTKVLTWLREMTGHTHKFPNLLALDFNETVFEMLELMWHGQGRNTVLSAFTERHGAEAMTDQHAPLSALFDALRECALFAQVFRDLDATMPA